MTTPAKTTRQLHGEMKEKASGLIGGLLAGGTRQIGEGGDPLVAAAVQSASRRMARQAAGAGVISRRAADERIAEADSRFAASAEQDKLERAAAELRADWPEMTYEQALQMAADLAGGDEQ